MPVKRGLVRIALAAAYAAVSHDAAAQSPEKLECARSFEQAQRLRQAHQLRAAKGELLVCTEKCPQVLRQQCVSWLGDVEASIPSLVVVARGPDGSVLSNARIVVDAVELAGGPMQQAVELDPGDHDLVIDAPGLAHVQQRVTLREGDRERRVDVTLSPAAPPVTSSSPSSSSAKWGGAVAPSDRPVPAVVYVLGGAGLAVAAVGTYFQIAGMNDASSLGGCQPNCPQEQIDNARTTLWAGNVTLAVGVVTLAAAVVLYLVRPAREHRADGAGFGELLRF
jgi:hypothetical protein